MRFQFSLRSLLFVVTLAGVTAASLRGWCITRLVYLVNSHIALFDAGRLADAERNAEWARWLYPDSPIVEYMTRECRVMQKLQRGEWISGGCLDLGADPFFDTAADLSFDEIEWQRLTDRRAGID